MNKNNYTPVINDNEYFEGFVGALGTIVSYFVFRQLFDENKNMGIVLGLTFISTWIIRKIGMNLYKDLKDELDVELSIFKVKDFLNFSKISDKKDYFYLVVTLFLIFIGFTATMTATKVLSPINITVFFVYVVAFFSLIHFSK